MTVAAEPRIRAMSVILNPVAGKSHDGACELIERAMDEAGIKARMAVTQKAGDAQRLAREAVGSGADAVAICGGDGTLMEAAAGLIGTDVPLVILPAGSANVMANELDIPKDIREACALVARHEFESQHVDAVESNAGHFIVRAAYGFEAEMVKNTDRATKNRLGVLAYFVAGARTLRRTRLVRYDVTIDGVRYRTQGMTCIVTNAGNLGFSKISLDPRVDVADGLLDVLVVKRADMKLARHVAVTLVKRERPDDGDIVAHWQGREVHVSPKPKQSLELDGEIFGRMPLHARVLPRAVRVLVPKPRKEEGSA